MTRNGRDLLLRLIFLFHLTGLLLAVSASVVSAQSSDLSYDEAEAYAIDRSLMCPVCPAETIDQSQVELAQQMRLKVRELLAQGKTRQEVLDYFVERYGAEVLAAPPKSGYNLIAWILPAIVVPLALLGGFLVIRSMTARRPAGSTTPTDGEDDELAPYLAAVDHDLALETGSPADPRQRRRESPPAPEASNPPAAP